MVVFLPIKMFQSHPKATKLFNDVKLPTNKPGWISLQYHYRIQTINKNPPGSKYGPINLILLTGIRGFLIQWMTFV